MFIARVQLRGQVTIPLDVRRVCGIEPGSDLYFVALGSGRFECRVLPPRRSLLELAARYAGEGLAPDLEVLREEMGDEISCEVLPTSVAEQTRS